MVRDLLCASVAHSMMEQKDNISVVNKLYIFFHWGSGKINSHEGMLIKMF